MKTVGRKTITVEQTQDVRVIQCDWCGKEIENGAFYARLFITKHDQIISNDELIKAYHDYCSECAIKYISQFKGLTEEK